MEATRREQLVEEWAARFVRWGLRPVAPVVFEVLGALGFLGSQALLFGQPLLTLFVDAPSIDEFASLLDDPDILAQIERRLTASDRSTL